ncbi:sigma-54-dependent transcriptional regulator [Marinagarivorans algicola]|uniref:sigma-54-dependent transcriptional regulator n=1 Tax=Marinagarivorans algicola TaxID=1513270 RepID=UPI0006B5A858|nr:sigma-54 dependent transcriptional regulator [Marinagarivorans algicola]
MSDKANIIVVEDTRSLAVTYEMYLSPLDANITICNNGKEAMACIKKQPPDIILLDLNLPDMSGQEVLRWICQHYTCPVVIVTAHGSVDIAMNLVRMGAKDFLEKPVNADRLRTTVYNCIETYQLKHAVAKIQEDIKREHYHGFIGSCPPIQAVYKTIDAAAPSDATVLITGESGTGKEVCAEAIKQQSSRANKPFIAINCGAIPRDLIESELFGHIKGAFTGAHTERKGAISEANGGTLFLDEIGEMPLDLQTKLLRFLQNKTVQKVGSSKVECVNVRVICATNRDPYEEVKNGNFREDLYYRLNVLPIHLPPLRMRGNDIILLAQYFLIKFTKEEHKMFTEISNHVKDIFLSFSWPGNIRQLQNVMRNIVVLHNDTTVQLEHLPAPLNQIKCKKNTSITSKNRIEIMAKNCISHSYNNDHKTSILTPKAFASLDNISCAIKNQHTIIDPSCSGTSYSLPQQLSEGSSHDQHPLPPVKTLATIEREAIEKAIELTGGNIPKAATLLDVSPSTIYRKKQQWNQPQP